MPRKREGRIYWKRGRAYGDFRDLGGGQEALRAPGESYAATDPDIAAELATERVKELEEKRRGRVILGTEGGVGLEEFAARHLLDKAKRGEVTRGWLGESEAQLRRAVDFFGADRDLTTITPTDLKEWLAYLATVKNGRGGTLSGGTIRHHLNALSNMFGSAIEDGVVTVNPVAQLGRGRRPKATRHEAKFFEAHEAALILEAAFRYKSEKSYQAIPFPGPLVATFLLTGGRKSEVLGLQVEDLSFDRGIVHIRPNDYRRIKTDKARRIVPLWPQLRDILQRHVFEDGHVSGLLFPSPGDPSNRRKGATMINDLERMLDGIAKTLGWEKGSIRSRMFRHTYCSQRLQTLDNGYPVSEFTVAREMGHEGTGLIHRIYGHLGTIRQRSEVVEYRVEDHQEELEDQLLALGWA